MAWYNFFSSEKAVDNVLNKKNGLIAQAGAWIGNLKLTDEEVMEQNGQIVKSVQKFVKDTLNESTDRSKSRRAIAIMWIKCQLAIILMACIVAPFNTILAEFYFKLGTSALMLMGTSAIIIFFFGSHGLVRHNESKKE